LSKNNKNLLLLYLVVDAKHGLRASPEHCSAPNPLQIFLNILKVPIFIFHLLLFMKLLTISIIGDYICYLFCHPELSIFGPGECFSLYTFIVFT